MSHRPQWLGFDPADRDLEGAPTSIWRWAGPADEHGAYTYAAVCATAGVIKEGGTTVSKTPASGFFGLTEENVTVAKMPVLRGATIREDGSHRGGQIWNLAFRLNNSSYKVTGLGSLLSLEAEPKRGGPKVAPDSWLVLARLPDGQVACHIYPPNSEEAERLSQWQPNDEEGGQQEDAAAPRLGRQAAPAPGPAPLPPPPPPAPASVAAAAAVGTPRRRKQGRTEGAGETPGRQPPEGTDEAPGPSQQQPQRGRGSGKKRGRPPLQRGQLLLEEDGGEEEEQERQQAAGKRRGPAAAGRNAYRYNLSEEEEEEEGGGTQPKLAGRKRGRPGRRREEVDGDGEEEADAAEALLFVTRGAPGSHGGKQHKKSRIEEEAAQYAAERQQKEQRMQKDKAARDARFAARKQALQEEQQEPPQERQRQRGEAADGKGPADRRQQERLQAAAVAARLAKKKKGKAPAAEAPQPARQAEIRSQLPGQAAQEPAGPSNAAARRADRGRARSQTAAARQPEVPEAVAAAAGAAAAAAADAGAGAQQAAGAGQEAALAALPVLLGGAAGGLPMALAMMQTAAQLGPAMQTLSSYLKAQQAAGRVDGRVADAATSFGFLPAAPPGPAAAQQQKPGGPMPNVRLPKSLTTLVHDVFDRGAEEFVEPLKVWLKRQGVRSFLDVQYASFSEMREALPALPTVLANKFRYEWQRRALEQHGWQGGGCSEWVEVPVLKFQQGEEEEEEDTLGGDEDEEFADAEEAGGTDDQAAEQDGE